MSSDWKVHYKYRKPDSSAWASNNTTVKAESEDTAIMLIKNKHVGYEVVITSIERK